MEEQMTDTLQFDEPRYRAAYALNLCTVSVSQIIDYDDIVVLEQEYDSILNNLNIERMPKDEALLHILKQLLDTITFFRIQEVDKKFVERDYQTKVKNAIWSAVPNVGILFAGGSVASMAVALASQVGVGYINYRKTKAESGYEYEKAMWHLHRAAIEQFNGLRRELFDTAWRLVDSYGIPDEYRLTERQVKQYNAILMDPDAVRRFERLDSIKDAFKAYPQFWYYFGNTANELMQASTGETADDYRKLAIEYYDAFIRSFSACNLLRENQIASACALEYIDMLSLMPDPDKGKMRELLDFAVKMSGNANDVMQLCAFAYLKLGDSQQAAGILRHLVNEDYNTVVNSQLLSAYYVAQFINGDNTAGRRYNYLRERIGEKYLYPFPHKSLLEDNTVSADTVVQSVFIRNQKDILADKYDVVLSNFRKKNIILFNKCIPVPGNKEYSDQYFDGTPEADEARKNDAALLRTKKGIAQYVRALIDCDYPYNFLPVLNGMLNDAMTLNCTAPYEHDLLSSLSCSIIQNRETLLRIRKTIEEGTKFSADTYNEILELSFDKLTASFFEKLRQYALEYIDTKDDILSINEAETNLMGFCNEQGFRSPEELYQTANDITDGQGLTKQYIGIELIDEGILTETITNKFREVKDSFTKLGKGLCKEGGTSRLLKWGDEEFERYFIHANLPSRHDIRKKTVVILDDMSEKDKDLLFTTEGVVQISKGKMKEAVPYDGIMIDKDSTGIIVHQEYSNDQIDMKILINIIGSLRTKPFEIDRRIRPFDFIARMVKQ